MSETRSRITEQNGVQGCLVAAVRKIHKNAEIVHALNYRDAEIGQAGICPLRAAITDEVSRVALTCYPLSQCATRRNISHAYLS